MINKIKKLIKFKDIIFVLTIILSFYIFVYIGMPIFNYGYIGLPFIAILLSIIMLLFDINKTEYATLTYKKTYKSKFGFILLIIGFIFFAILPIGSINVFRSSEYYKLIGIGDNVDDAKFNYQLSLNKNGVVDSVLIPTKVKIDRYGLDIIGGVIYYNFTTKDYPNKIFITTSNISSDIIFTKKDDDILMEVYKLNDDNKYILKYFKNLTLNNNN